MRKFKKELDFEHSILQERSEELEMLEFPLSQRVFLFLGIAALALGGIVGGRIFFLAVQKGDFYKARAEMNMTQPLTIPAARGFIYDRFGEILVRNESSYRAVINVGLIKREKIDLDPILENESLILKVEKSELLKLVEKADLEKSALVTLARNISKEQAGKIMESGIPALEIHDDYRREYLKGPAFAHVLGYTGFLQFKDLEGKTGLEKYYNDALAGKDGLRLMYRDALGNILEEKLLQAPEDGRNLYTTIDAGLQEYFYISLKQALANLGREVGVGIALDPRNGEVLALVNVPSFNSNAFTESESNDERVWLLTAASHPLFNRAVSGMYSPGSTVKPLVALAALEEGVIGPEKQIFSAGFIDIPNPYFPDQPSRFLDWKAHGWVDLRSALARSSNIYFYAVGGGLGDVRGLGIGKLNEYWRKFGFGVKTGIDLDAENIGFLPNPEEKEARKKDIWRIGDTYNVSIGQGDLLVTPIQLINQIAGIANDGIMYQPHLMEKIAMPDGRIAEENQPKIINDFSGMHDLIVEVRKGMADAVAKPYGTAQLLSNLPFSVGAKTGSAQIANNTRTNAFFAGYAPAENPEIAILVLIENAREGSLNAVPVGKDVLEWYYYNRLLK